MKQVLKLENGRVKVVTKITKESKTQQQFGQQTDINWIMKRYQDTGMISHVNRSQGQYIDVSEIPSYQDSLNMVIKAQTMFQNLPSYLRKRFGNNPQQMLDFMADPQNANEALELGLLDPEKVNARQKANDEKIKKTTKAKNAPQPSTDPDPKLTPEA